MRERFTWKVCLEWGCGRTHGISSYNGHVQMWKDCGKGRSVRGARIWHAQSLIGQFYIDISRFSQNFHSSAFFISTNNFIQMTHFNFTSFLKQLRYFTPIYDFTSLTYLTITMRFFTTHHLNVSLNVEQRQIFPQLPTLMNGSISRGHFDPI